MEGWDGTEDGQPTDLTRRRWRNFGLSGAKLIWGGEAFAVVPEGRANPNQLMARPDSQKPMAELRQILLDAHGEAMGNTSDVLLGLQLTHSGRFCRPFRKDRMEPAILYHHPILDGKFGLDSDYPLMEDSYIDDLVGHYVRAAKLAWEVGYQFVDVKHCHGYLGMNFSAPTSGPDPTAVRLRTARVLPEKSSRVFERSARPAGGRAPECLRLCSISPRSRWRRRAAHGERYPRTFYGCTAL